MDIVLLFFLTVIPLLYILPDINSYVKSYRKTSYLHGLAARLLIIGFYLFSRFALLYVILTLYSPAISQLYVGSNIFTVCIVIVDGLLWTLVKRVQPEEAGMKVIHLGLLFTTEFLLLYPLALILYVAMKMLMPNVVA